MLSKRIFEKESESINVELIRTTETNVTLLEALEEAAHQSKKFLFTGKEFPGLGLYITSIGGLYENKTENKFWMIYKVDETGEHFTPKGI